VETVRIGSPDIKESRERRTKRITTSGIIRKRRALQRRGKNKKSRIIRTDSPEALTHKNGVSSGATNYLKRSAQRIILYLRKNWNTSERGVVGGEDGSRDCRVGDLTQSGGCRRHTDL